MNITITATTINNAFLVVIDGLKAMWVRVLSGCNNNNNKKGK